MFWSFLATPQQKLKLDLRGFCAAQSTWGGLVGKDSEGETGSPSPRNATSGLVAHKQGFEAFSSIRAPLNASCYRTACLVRHDEARVLFIWFSWVVGDGRPRLLAL